MKTMEFISQELALLLRMPTSRTMNSVSISAVLLRTTKSLLLEILLSQTTSMDLILQLVLKVQCMSPETSTSTVTKRLDLKLGRQISLLPSVVPTQESLVRADLDLLQLVTMVNTISLTMEKTVDRALLKEVIIHVSQLMGLAYLSASLVIQAAPSPLRTNRLLISWHKILISW